MSINFLEIYNKFKDKLSNGDRAEIKRATEPSDLETLPAFYKLLGNRLNEQHEKQWQRVIFFLGAKDLKHEKDGLLLGQVFKQANVNEKRMFQVIRSESPNDLIQLRRLVIYIKPTLDFQKMANALWYWNPDNKKRILKDFYRDFKGNNKEEENE